MRIPATLFILCLVPGAALAGEITSAYSKIDPKACTQIDPANPEEEWGGALLCPGYGKMKVYLASGDLRDMVAYGTDPAEHCAAIQTFGPFNGVQETIEWRLEDGKPFAAIQRWKVSDPEDSEKTTSWLAITRIEADNSCRVATVQGSYPSANEKARQVADGLARSFNCERDEAQVVSDPPGNELGGTSSSPCATEQ